jgi:hypothetical protein
MRTLEASSHVGCSEDKAFHLSERVVRSMQRTPRANEQFPRSYLLELAGRV